MPKSRCGSMRVLVAPLAISNHAPPLQMFLTPDVYAPPSLRLTSNSWGHFTFSDKTARLPACAACLNLNSCLSSRLHLHLASVSALCLSHLSLLLFYYYYLVIIRDFIIVHAVFIHSLTGPSSSRPAPTRKQTRSISSYPRFSICTPSLLHLGLQSG